jgi:hypothetical protein
LYGGAKYDINCCEKDFLPAAVISDSNGHIISALSSKLPPLDRMSMLMKQRQLDLLVVKLALFWPQITHILEGDLHAYHLSLASYYQS